MNSDTQNFLEALLFTLPEDAPRGLREATVHDFHPEFIEAVDGFCQVFRDYLWTWNRGREARGLEPIDPDSGERSFGGNVYFSLSGHGCGFWDDRDPEYAEAMQSALEAFSGRKYRFEEIDLSRFNGKIHLSYQTAGFRREALAAIFSGTVTTAAK